MDQEQSWLSMDVGNDSNPVVDNYEYFMRPEPRENLGPIVEEFDELLQRTIKTREVRFGMVRNAKDEDKKTAKAYLEPYPHLRIDKAKPLQGWYKSLYEPPGVRNRPCFTEAILTEPYGGYCQVGCAFCCVSGTSLITPDGKKNIEDIKVGEYVLGRNYSLGFGKVLAVTNRTVYTTVLLTLSNGRKLEVTPDHLVWSETRKDWIYAQDIVQGEQVQTLRKRYERQAENLLQKRMLVGSKSKKKTSPQTLQILSPTYSKKIQNSLRQQKLFNSSEKRGSSINLESTRGEVLERRTKEKVQSILCFSTGRDEKKMSTSPKIRRMEERTSRSSTPRNIRLQVISSRNLHLPKGETIYYEEPVGNPYGGIPRQLEHRLGIRTKSNNVKFGRVLTGLCVEERENIDRSKRIFFESRQGEVGRNEKTRLQSSSLRSEEVDNVENTNVINIELIEGAKEVWDIQTTTENFYAEGTLVHNCYVNAGFRGYRGTGLITVPVNYGDQIRDQLNKMRRSAAGYFSSFTDPFLPLEDWYHNTQRAAEEFVKLGLPIFFLSRLRYPNWAIELLKQNKYSYAQKSINTPDPRNWQLLSPGALPLEEHMEDIARLRRNKIYVSIQVNPIVPGVVNHGDVIKLFEKLSKAGANHVIVKFVEAGYSWAGAMVERIKKRFGQEIGEEFESLFTENIGGQKTIVEEYRLQGHKLYSTAAKRFGMTYATCYEYRMERDAQGNVINKTGVSIGREFTTAEQCHGQRVPMFTRESADEPFQEVKECPPSGCLYCASENGGTSRCGDTLAGKAPALRLVDLKLPIKREPK